MLCEVGVRGGGNFASCMLTRIGDKAVVLRLGRRCGRRAGTRLRAIGWRWNQEESESWHRKASCCEVRLGPMRMLAPQCGQRQVANWELSMRGLGRGWQVS